MSGNGKRGAQTIGQIIGTFLQLVQRSARLHGRLKPDSGPKASATDTCAPCWAPELGGTGALGPRVGPKPRKCTGAHARIRIRVRVRIRIRTRTRTRTRTHIRIRNPRSRWHLHLHTSTQQLCALAARLALEFVCGARPPLCIMRAADHR